MSSTVISCVVDRQPKFYLQALNWMTSLRAVVDEQTRIEIHHVGPAPDWFIAVAANSDARVSQIEPFGDGPAVYCNKLQQLERLSDLKADVFVLSDADIVFLSSPAEWAIADTVRAKIVDFVNPEESVLKALLQRAGFSAENLKCRPDFQPEKRTHRLNCNGGLYVLTKRHLEQLHAPWKKWSNFCLDQAELLAEKTFHADQLGFMLAMLELKLPFAPLPVDANFPTHLNTEAYDCLSTEDIRALHYHNRFDTNGLLLPTGVRLVDSYIGAANRMLFDRRYLAMDGVGTDPATLAGIVKPNEWPAQSEVRRIYQFARKTINSVWSSWARPAIQGP